MGDVKDIIDDATLEWLLEPEDPSVRYRALTELLGLAPDDPDVVQARKDIMAYGPVKKILDTQDAAGHWGEETRFYLDTYRGTVWQVLILAELAADPADARIKNACNFLLDQAQDRESFGFAYNSSGKNEGGRHSEVIPCLTGNMVYSLIKLGFLADVRVERAIEWICRYQRCDDGGAEAPKGWPYDLRKTCWGKHSCHMGVVKSLKALAAIHPEERSDAVSEKIAELVEYLLKHRIFKKSHNPAVVSRPGWLKFGFPLMYQSDALEILGLIAGLGYRDDRLQDAIEAVTAKQQADRRWILENSFNGRMRCSIETKGESSKWLTLRALAALSLLS